MQFDWNHIRQISSLSILFLVCSADAADRLENELSLDCQVSATFSPLCRMNTFACDRMLLLAATEYAWNVFPSTTTSSLTLLATNALLIYGLWGASDTRIRDMDHALKND